MKIINTLIFGIITIGIVYGIISYLENVPAAKGTSLIVTAFDSETAPFLDSLQDTVNLTENYSYCEHVYKGTLFETEVLVATTGMGKVHSALCTEELLTKTADISEVILSGISGISPRKGSTPVMLGDTCINALAVDFAAQHYTSDQGNGITKPQYWDNEFDSITSQTKGDIILARELYLSSLLIPAPVVPRELANVIRTYHSTLTANKSWGPEECIEATDDLFWHDTAADKSARYIGSRWINESLNLSTTPDTITVATAMESAAVGATVEQWNISHESTIRFAYVRSASNYDLPPTSKGSAISGYESILLRESDDGVEFASGNAATVVLKMFETRAGISSK